MSLENTKTLLGVDDARVEIIYRQIEARLLSRLKQHNNDLNAVPADLEYIVMECAIARFNRIGSEGMSSESLDGHTANYADMGLSDYEDDIKRYLKEDDASHKRGRVRFL